MPIERAHFFRLMGSFASGVTVITNLGNDRVPRGFTASAFSSLSLEPMLCLVCIDIATESLPAIQATGTFAVNILADGQQEISRRFASKGGDKFVDMAYRQGAHTGAPIFEGVVAWIECRVKDMLQGGDHLIMVADVLEGDVTDTAPLLYFRGEYRRLAS